MQTFKGWLVVLHKTSIAEPTFTFNAIFSFFDIFFPAGMTYSGKVNGTFKVRLPSPYNSFWDQLMVIDKVVPPSILSTGEDRVSISSNNQNQKHLLTKKCCGVAFITCGIVRVYILEVRKPPSTRSAFSAAFLFLSSSAISEVRNDFLGASISQPRTEPC